MTATPAAIGIACPDCKATASTVYRTNHRRGVTVRRRKCSKCRREFRTQESVIGTDSPPMVLDMRSGRISIKNLLESLATHIGFDVPAIKLEIGDPKHDRPTKNAS